MVKTVDEFRGMNTENAEINEGLARFDIVFYVRMKDGRPKVIINIEAQKDEPTGCRILNRAVFYVSRLVSSQKERDFVNQNYNDIKRVFSIWVCMNMDESSMAYVHLTKEDLIGSYPWKGGIDLLNIILIGMADDIPVDGQLRRDVSAMCNLSQGIRERTLAERDEKIILNMCRDGYSSEQIARIVEKSIEEAEAVIIKREPVPV